MSSSEHLILETPENIQFGYDLADIGSRFLAILIDSLIQGAIYIILFMSLAFASSGLSSLPSQIAQGSAVALVLIIFIIQFGYFMFFELIWNGQTPGKRLFGLRVIKDNGYPLAPMDSIIRNLIRVIDFFPFAYGVGVITMFANKRAKRLGDFAGGTVVAKTREQVKLQDLQTPAPTVTSSVNAVQQQGISRLSEDDIELAESFLRRRYDLTNAATLGPQMAQQLAAKMGLPASEALKNPNNAVTFLREAVSAYRQPRAETSVTITPTPPVTF